MLKWATAISAKLWLKGKTPKHSSGFTGLKVLSVAVSCRTIAMTFMCEILTFF
jgi:hypothetical protein